MQHAAASQSTLIDLQKKASDFGLPIGAQNFQVQPVILQITGVVVPVTIRDQISRFALVSSLVRALKIKARDKGASGIRRRSLPSVQRIRRYRQYSLSL